MTDKLAAARIVIAGTGGDSGKTIVSMGLAASWRRHGYKVAVFKKGPDYIDAAWLKFAAGRTTRNLDAYMMGTEGVKKSFDRYHITEGVNLIEGNRGLYDGFNHRGTVSTAELAKLLHAPVILVQDVTKVTRTAAAVVLGCRHLDPDVQIAGVILNRVAGRRHERVVRDAIESICDIPVLGAVPRRGNERYLPERHLGLVTPEEHPELRGVLDKIVELIENSVDVDRVLEIAQAAPDWEGLPLERTATSVVKTVRIAYFHDSAFTFYYPENLEALEEVGAELIPVSSLDSPELPPCDGLYIGGGFPETHAGRLARNAPLLQSVRDRALAGLPIYAECGGLIYLCRSITYQDQTYPLANVFPIDLQMFSRPQGHGYMEVLVDKPNPFFPVQTRIRGHEFHYSRIVNIDRSVETVFKVERGHGAFEGRDGLYFRNVCAGYLHIHAASVLGWAEQFVKAASDHQKGWI